MNLKRRHLFFSSNFKILGKLRSRNCIVNSVKTHVYKRSEKVFEKRIGEQWTRHDPNGISSRVFQKRDWRNRAVDGICGNGSCRDNDVCFPERIALDTRYRVSLHGRCNWIAGFKRSNDIEMKINSFSFRFPDAVKGTQFDKIWSKGIILQD